MERMEINLGIMTKDQLKKFIVELEEENKNLKEDSKKLESAIGDLVRENRKLKEKISELEDVSKDYDLLSKDFITLGEENKKLNIKVAGLEGEIKGLNYTIDKLKEENQTLELWLDNKEKVNKSLREELSAYDREYFDEDKKAKNIFMEEDTLQELRDIGKL